ncbi:MAG TPA: urea transporter [Bacteroidales bacterium]|nr:urea transporter [Bacteroidales bacterium]
MLPGSVKEYFKGFVAGILNSYSQIFFSDNRVFSIVLLLVSFADVYAGLAGIISVMAANITAVLIGLDRGTMKKGIFGYNSLLVGLSLGIFYSPGIVLFVLILLASILTLFISVSLQGVIGKYNLPFLSIPFVLGAWIMTLATRNMTFLAISERGIFTINELYTVGGDEFVRLYDWWNNIAMIKPLKVYFISLGAIIFQYNVLSGIIISAGLLYFSRISFSLSLAGFFAAYSFYRFVGADITEVSYSYIGFNYILTSIAIGGFFIIPSLRSYIWSLLLVPIVALLSLSLYSLFSSAALPVYALPFSLIVLLFLYVLKFRIKPSKKLAEVVIQQNSPEKNLYSFENDVERFRYDIVSMKLPFHGTWSITQGYDGSETHKGLWSHGLDFVIIDQKGNQFNDKGDIPENYFCFNKPVLATADGIVELVIDDIDDNIIGKPNIRENWGNTVIIRHTPYVFSSMSHLRKASVPVKPGDRVKHGTVIGKCGNSGRSSYPHLHFQVQALPYLGSHTISYPFSYYLQKGNSKFEFMNYSIPEITQLVTNVQTNELLVKAFDFIPGKTFCFESDINGKKEFHRWEVDANEYNIPFIRCLTSGSVAYFSNDGELFMFRHYDGKKNTLLYYFFLAALRVPLGFYKETEISDRYPLNIIMNRFLLFLQDFLAPFVKFVRSEYNMKYQSIDNELLTTKIKLASSAVNYFNRYKLSGFEFGIEITEKGISALEIYNENVLLTAACSCEESS